MPVEFQMKLPVSYQDKDGWVIACCPILDVFTQGRNREEAKKNLIEAVSLFFISCFERGTLNDVLLECGFRPGFPPTIKKKEDRTGFINVPIPLIADRSTPRCRA